MGRWWRFVLIAVLVLGAAGCAPSPGPPPPASRSVPAPTVPSPAQAAADAGDEAVGRADAVVGIAVLDRTTGTLATNSAGATPFNSASLSKVLTALDVLTGPSAATATDLALIRRALGPSDDEAMNTLWSRTDGEDGIERVVESLDLQDTSAPDDASQWGEVQLSSRDTTSVLRYVAEDLAPDARDVVLSALAAAPTVAADGFDQAFGLLDPERNDGTPAKQGWLCCLDDRLELHSAGLTGPDERFVVAILSQQPYGYAAARQELDDVAAAIRDELGA